MTYDYTVQISGIRGNYPECAMVKVDYATLNTPSNYKVVAVSDNNPNITVALRSLDPASPVDIILLDADSNEIARMDDVVIHNTVSDWDLSGLTYIPGYGLSAAISGITGSFPEVDTIRFTGEKYGTVEMDVRGVDITGTISYTYTFNGENVTVELLSNGTVVGTGSYYVESGSGYA